MKHFARKDLSCEEHIFNNRLSRAEGRGWVCIWCSNSMMVFVRAIEMNFSKAERIVRCICLLHNIIVGLEGTTQDPSVLQEAYKFLDPIISQQMSAVGHSIGPQKKQQI